jgi:hypothetical protein
MTKIQKFFQVDMEGEQKMFEELEKLLKENEKIVRSILMICLFDDIS